MNKSVLSSVTLAFTVILILGGCATMYDPDFGTTVGQSAAALGLGLVLAFVTWRLRVDVKKEQQAKALQAQKEHEELMEKARIEREKQEEERRRQRELFRYERYAVAGVTFKNDDGTDRQRILREIYLNSDAHCGVWFEEDEELGEESGIRVLTEFGCVGFVRRSDKAKIRRFFGRAMQTAYLAVELFENDDGQKIYRADIQIVMKRDDPDQQWYFDELQKS